MTIFIIYWLNRLIDFSLIITFQWLIYLKFTSVSLVVLCQLIIGLVCGETHVSLTVQLVSVRAHWPLKIWINHSICSLGFLGVENLVHQLILPFLFAQFFHHSLDDLTLWWQLVLISPVDNLHNLVWLLLLTFGDLRAVAIGRFGPERVLIIVHIVIGLIMFLRRLVINQFRGA